MTLRAHCEIEEPDPTVMRDVVLTLNDKIIQWLFYTLLGMNLWAQVYLFLIWMKTEMEQLNVNHMALQ